jgi:predicted RNA-binding Zn-ribbon protein involved in translation (DUF1610 family)
MQTIPCRKCGTPLDLNTTSGIFRCPTCGFTRPETLDEASERIRARGERPVVSLTQRGAVDFRARTLFENGQDALWHGDKGAAIRAFQQAIDIQPDFADAHLWIAKTSSDPAVQRDHLGDILARDPGHQEALRLLMVLKGELTPEQAERSQQARSPEIRIAEGAVAASATALHCPVCGGDLTIDEANGRVVCKFCGHVEPLDASRRAGDGTEVLGAAMLKRRTQAVRWVVGKRILHCNQCGAERTIPAGRLSAACPFCGSTQVIQQDALNTIEQPDGLIPFAISEDAAQSAIRERLKRVDERLAGLFNTNEVARAAIEGVYLPYWVFDAVAEVSITTIDRRTPTSRQALTTIRPYDNVRLSDGLVGIPVAGVKSPALAGELRDFDLSMAVGYEPKLLARYPAALYDVDFDDASLEARSRVSEAMRRRHGQNSTRNVEVTVYTSVLQMTFTLLLMPVWVATLTERDGDVRPALVSGQSGAVVLGKAQKTR